MSCNELLVLYAFSKKADGFSLFPSYLCQVPKAKGPPTAAKPPPPKPLPKQKVFGTWSLSGAVQTVTGADAKTWRRAGRPGSAKSLHRCLLISFMSPGRRGLAQRVSVLRVGCVLLPVTFPGRPPKPGYKKGRVFRYVLLFFSHF